MGFVGYLEGNVLNIYKIPDDSSIYVASLPDKYVRQTSSWSDALKGVLLHVVSDNYGEVSDDVNLVEKSLLLNQPLPDAESYQVIEPI